jgi:hypothetical protein
MPRNCSICIHASRDHIDAELLHPKPFKELAARFEVSSSALHRHAQTHIRKRLIKAKEAVEVGKADNLVRQIESLKAKASQILQKAESGGDLRTALAGVRELARLIELVAKMTSDLRISPINTVNVELIDTGTAEKMAKAFLESRNKELP